MSMKFMSVMDSEAQADFCRSLLDVDREAATQLGRETVAWVEAGFYDVDSERIAIPDQKSRALSIPPDEVLLAVDPHPERLTLVEVANEPSLATAFRLHEQGRSPLVLNLANGVSPGGGFLHGSRAQEEYLCRISGLYENIRDNPMYAYHFGLGHYESSDWMIVSPNVLVIRNDAGVPLRTPWTCSFISSAAPVAQRVGVDQSADIMVGRIDRLLHVAAVQGFTSLVLGAWGCGAFGNDPGRTAQAFVDSLTGRFDGVFESVAFAITDWSPERRFLQPFVEAFNRA